MDDIMATTLEQIIKNLKDLRSGIFKDAAAVNGLIDETILMAEQENDRPKPFMKPAEKKFTLMDYKCDNCGVDTKVKLYLNEDEELPNIDPPYFCKECDDAV